MHTGGPRKKPLGFEGSATPSAAYLPPVRGVPPTSASSSPASGQYAPSPDRTRHDPDERLRQALEDIRLHNHQRPQEARYHVAPMPNPHTVSRSPSPTKPSASPSASPFRQRILAPMLGLGKSRSDDSRSRDHSASVSPAASPYHPTALTPGVMPWSSGNSTQAGFAARGPLPPLPPGLRVDPRLHDTRLSPQYRHSQSPSPTRRPFSVQHPSHPSEYIPSQRPTSIGMLPSSSSTSTLLPGRPPNAGGTPPVAHRRTQSAGSNAVPIPSASTVALKPGKQQCAGIKKDGTRCTRLIPTPGATVANPSPAKKPSAPAHPAETEEEVPDYCFQHVAEINKTSGFHLPDGTHVAFLDYIPPSLSPRAQARLRTVMTTPPSQADLKEKGYLYIYELRDRATNDTVCLKVGRSINVFKRLDEWRSKCQSKDPILRCFLPAPPGQLLLAGASAASHRGLRLSRKWERLCHVELEDLGHRVNEACSDCSSRHREIFSVEAVKGGYNSVQAVAERWLRFTARASRSYAI